METKSHESAMPFVSVDFSQDADRIRNYRNHSGLTKREYFAAFALQGILANAGIHAMVVKKDIGKERTVLLHVHMAIDHADALIKELNKTQV